VAAKKPANEPSAAGAVAASEETNSIEEAAIGGAAAAAAMAAEYDETTGFAVEPLRWCAHLDDITKLSGELDTSEPCGDCGHVGENWVCLTCYKVYCSRYVNEHMLFHSIATDHKMVLSYADLSVWCYACDSYVHNAELLPMKNSAHRHKFGRDAQPQQISE